MAQSVRRDVQEVSRLINTESGESNLQFPSNPAKNKCQVAAKPAPSLTIVEIPVPLKGCYRSFCGIPVPTFAADGFGKTVTPPTVGRDAPRPSWPSSSLLVRSKRRLKPFAHAGQSAERRRTLRFGPSPPRLGAPRFFIAPGSLLDCGVQRVHSWSEKLCAQRISQWRSR